MTIYLSDIPYSVHIKYGRAHTRDTGRNGCTNEEWWATLVGTRMEWSTYARNTETHATRETHTGRGGIHTRNGGTHTRNGGTQTRKGKT
jgi:hypothetical protein